MRPGTQLVPHSRLTDLILPGSRVCFTGSRTYTKREPVSDVIYWLSWIDVIVNVGDAKGLDSLVPPICLEYGIDYSVYRAKWLKYKRQAGMRRNYAMVMNSDYVISFYDELTPGTRNAIDTGRRSGRMVIRATEEGIEVI